MPTTTRQRVAFVLAVILFGPFLLVEHVFWIFWGMWGTLLGLIAGPEPQVRIWATRQVGPTYASTLLGPFWSYFGHEVEKRVIADGILRGGSLPKRVYLSSVEHEHAAFTFSRTRTLPIYGMGGAESRPLVGTDGEW